MDNNKAKYLSDVLSESNIILSDIQIEQFINYYDLLVEWNEKINLTSIVEFEDVCIKHFLDCLSIIKAFDSLDNLYSYFNGKSLVDVGTGAGFPGIPLKILLPNLSVTLIDSLDKRVKFLNEVISKLSLNDIVAYHGRVEDLAIDSQFRERFDYATARAVASLPVLCEYCLPFVKVGGYFISYKSEKAEAELNLSANALSILGGTFDRDVSFSLNDTDNSRTILFIEKTSFTPDKYPRKAGKPVKKPL
ncbi:MAG: 16S rRNA (guanine(527)-N(7))-methyltransferase RsmG [Firmicutes bacterium]|nr:16S rRNA (guanine(527)-N(7))-methyltransferase RsmG [Candidatus Colivicinus equi]